MTCKNSVFFSLSLIFLSKTFAATTSAQPCSSQHTLNRVSIRHIESKGVGYDQGYTTLEGFFVPLSSLNTQWVPFLDIRGHIFNNSKPAANAGFGLRYINSRVWGGNVYYDYRKTSKNNYNQISFGLESLGRYIDYRVNGYFPLGIHKSSFYDPSFHSFSGHFLYIARKQQIALKGGNGEVSIHIAKVKGIDFYSALGPYYFGHNSKRAVGGEFRIGMDVLNILTIEGNTSYDQLFKWIGQGQVSLSYSFNPKKISRQEKKGSCSFRGFVRERAFQRVDKQEIVVVTTQKKKSVAINPATGLPYIFWFVDNTSQSQGTYESPFNTLLAAHTASNPNDIIAVLPGDGTDKGMNVGITLRDGQKLWGMSLVHSLITTLGNIKISPIANQMPLLSNTGYNANVINAGNSNDVEGLRILETRGNNGIGIQNMNGNYNIENNIIFSMNGGGRNAGVILQNSTGNTIIANNTFIGADNSRTGGVGLIGSSGNVVVTNNLFTGIDEKSGISCGIALNYTSAPLTCSIIGNKMNFNPAAQNMVLGIRIGTISPATNTTVLMADNTINNIYLGLTRALNGGIGIEVTGSLFSTLRNNHVTSLDPIKMPAYNFQIRTGSSSQINFAPDNIGNVNLSVIP